MIDEILPYSERPLRRAEQERNHKLRQIAELESQARAEADPSIQCKAEALRAELYHAQRQGLEVRANTGGRLIVTARR